ERVVRQTRRLERIKHEGRDTTRPAALLETLIGRQVRCERYLQMVLGWCEKHPRRKFPPQIKNRFMKPRPARETKKERLARWDNEVRAFLDKQCAKAPHYKASLIALWQKFGELELPNAHFVLEFTSGKKEVMLQRAWEMMLARHLDARGYRITTSDDGP